MLEQKKWLGERRIYLFLMRVTSSHSPFVTTHTHTDIYSFFYKGREIKKKGKKWPSTSKGKNRPLSHLYTLTPQRPNITSMSSSISSFNFLHAPSVPTYAQSNLNAPTSPRCTGVHYSHWASLDCLSPSSLNNNFDTGEASKGSHHMGARKEI
jgi:hypothetical protein